MADIESNPEAVHINFHIMRDTTLRGSLAEPSFSGQSALAAALTQ